MWSPDAVGLGGPKPTVLITGGSRGIGRMMARGFVEAGAQVVVSSRDADACRTTADELDPAGEGRCLPMPADLSTAEGTDALVSRLRAEAGPLKVLVNNAGAAWGAPLDEYPVAAFDKLWNLNVKGVFGLTQQLLPDLRGTATPDDPSRIINIGSVDGLRVPFFDNYAYSATKAALHMLTQHMAVALAPEAITVNAIAPGPFRSKMIAAALEDEGALVGRVPMGRIGEPRDIAALACFLAGPGATWMTGAVIPLDGGLSLAP